MLLEARKVHALERLYAAYGRRLLRRTFASVRVGGAAWPETPGPAIAYANHSAWWDPVLAVFLSHDVLRRDGYGIMEGAQLRKFPFFRTVGCFGATAETLDDARRLSHYAAALLRGGARRTLWIFPQGALRPARAPLDFRSGAARLARAVPEAPLVSVAIRYAFRDEQRPECFVRFGEPLPRAARDADGAETESAPALTRRMERRLRAELDALDADLSRGAVDAYRAVLGGRESLHSFYERTVGRLDF